MWLFVMYIGKDVVIPRLFFLLTNGGGTTVYLSAMCQYMWMICISYLFVNSCMIEQKQIAVKEDEYVKSIMQIVIITISLFAFMQFFRYAINMLVYVKTGEVLILSGLYSIKREELIVLLLVHGVWAPISEEYVYRHLMFSLLKKNSNEMISMMTVSICFAIAHNSLEQIIQTFIFSVVLCLIYLKFRKVYYCIVIHIGYNMLGIVQTYIYNPLYDVMNKAIKYNTVLENIIFSLVAILIGGIAVYLIIICIGKKEDIILKYGKKQLCYEGIVVSVCLFVQGIKHI